MQSDSLLMERAQNKVCSSHKSRERAIFVKYVRWYPMRENDSEKFALFKIIFISHSAEYTGTYIPATSPTVSSLTPLKEFPSGSSG